MWSSHDYLTSYIINDKSVGINFMYVYRFESTQSNICVCMYVYGFHPKDKKKIYIWSPRNITTALLLLTNPINVVLQRCYTLICIKHCSACFLRRESFHQRRSTSLSQFSTKLKIETKLCGAKENTSRSLPPYINGWWWSDIKLWN